MWYHCIKELIRVNILTFDPSGNFGKEGFGITGWAYFEGGELKDFGEVKAEDWDNQETYWHQVSALIIQFQVTKVICEGYRLYSGARGKAQINSTLDTPQLIGYIRMICWHKGIECDIQAPADKKPVDDTRLVRAGVFEKKGNKHYCMDRSTNLHMRDAIRHGIYYYRFGKGKNDVKRDHV
jgi:hypothetical protein